MANGKTAPESDIEPISWQVEAAPLKSSTPIFGPLIAWIRNSVNSISTRWYLVPVLRQQNDLNQRLAEQNAQLQQQLSDQDHEISQMVHDIAEISEQLVQMNSLLSDLEEKLTELESEKTAAAE